MFFIVTYPTLNFAGIMWYLVTAGNGDVITYYSSPPGILSLILLVIAAARFAATIRTSRRNFPEFDVFFKQLQLLGLLYILYAPILAIINTGAGELFQLKIYVVFQQIIFFVVNFIFLVLYHPKLLPQSFPFHATIEDMKRFKLKVAEEKDLLEKELIKAANAPKVISFTGM